MVHNGTIDSDYRGNVGVILFNLSNEEYVIERGDRIAQLIIERCYSPKFVEVSEFTKIKLKEGRGGWVWFYRCLIFPLSFLVKKVSKKMESKYANLHTFEKKLYFY